MTLPNPSTGDVVAASHITGIKDHLEGASGSTAPYHLRQSTGNFIITLPDAAAATKLRLNDSAGTEVFSVDSDGTITHSGTYAPGSLTLPTSASPAPTTDGQVVWDSDDNNIAIGNGSTTQVFFSDDKGSDIASATTLTPSNGHFFHVTGTTTVTGISSKPAGLEVIFYFKSAVTLTHNATSFILSQSASRTTVPGEIARFISEGSGNWREISTAFSTGYGYSTANQSVTSSTTLVDATGLTIPVVANGVYDLVCKLPYTAGSGGDMKIGLIGPSGCFLQAEYKGPALTSSTWTAVIGTSTDISTPSTISLEGGTNYICIIDGIIRNGANAGNVKVQFAQQTSNGTATTLLSGAFIKMIRTA